MKCIYPVSLWIARHQSIFIKLRVYSNVRVTRVRLLTLICFTECQNVLQMFQNRVFLHWTGLIMIHEEC